MNPTTVRRLFLPFFHRRIATLDGVEHIPEPPYLIAANHIDFLDGFYLSAAFLATKKHAVTFLTKTNNYGWTGATIPIDLEHPGAVLDRAAEILRQKKIVCNFPEGQRNPTDRLLTGKTGTVRLALSLQLPILPVGISGLKPTTYFFPSVWNTLRGTGRVAIRIGEPFRPAPESGDPLANHQRQTAELMRRLAGLCDKQPPPS